MQKSCLFWKQAAFRDEIREKRFEGVL